MINNTWKVSYGSTHMRNKINEKTISPNYYTKTESKPKHFQHMLLKIAKKK